MNDAVYVGEVGRSIYLALKAEARRRDVHIGTESHAAARFSQGGKPFVSWSTVELARSGQSGKRQSGYMLLVFGASSNSVRPVYDVERRVRDYVATRIDWR